MEYLGHVIDKEGIQPTEKKVEAILAAKSPNNIEQLQSFMGMVNYYGKFIPKLSTIAAPLNDLRKKEVKWNWTKREEEVFNQLKKQLASAEVLVLCCLILTRPYQCQLLEESRDGHSF